MVQARKFFYGQLFSLSCLIPQSISHESRIKHLSIPFISNSFPFISHSWSIHIPFIISIDWFKGKIQENPISWKHICMYIYIYIIIYILYIYVWFPVDFPSSQPIESRNCRFFVSSVTRCKFSLACCVKWPRGGTFRDRMLSVLMGIMVTLW